MGSNETSLDIITNGKQKIHIRKQAVVAYLYSPAAMQWSFLSALITGRLEAAMTDSDFSAVDLWTPPAHGQVLARSPASCLFGNNVPLPQWLLDAWLVRQNNKTTGSYGTPNKEILCLRAPAAIYREDRPTITISLAAFRRFDDLNWNKNLIRMPRPLAELGACHGTRRRY
jgi:hypothetical protein